MYIIYIYIYILNIKWLLFFLNNATFVIVIFLSRSLSFNQISTLPKGLLSNNGELDNLKIDNNPLICDCRINWLVDWLKQQQLDNNDDTRSQR